MSWITQGRKWIDGLENGRYESRAEIARQEGVSRAYVTQVLRRFD